MGDLGVRDKVEHVIAGLCVCVVCFVMGVK